MLVSVYLHRGKCMVFEVCVIQCEKVRVFLTIHEYTCTHDAYTCGFVLSTTCTVSLLSLLLLASPSTTPSLLPPPLLIRVPVSLCTAVQISGSTSSMCTVDGRGECMPLPLWQAPDQVRSYKKKQNRGWALIGIAFFF